MMQAVSPLQYKIIMNKIKKEHRLIEGRCIKYVETNFDFRDCMFWRFVFRSFGSKKVEFTTANRGFFKDNKWVADEGFLFDEIMEWLEKGKNNE